MGDSQRLIIKGVCYDCKEHVVIRIERISSTQISIIGGALYKPPVNWNIEEEFLCKCDSCYESIPMFGKSTQIYSRLIKYMIPIKSWNGAKEINLNID